MLRPEPLFKDWTGFNTFRSYSAQLCICDTYIRGEGAGLDNMQHCFDYYCILKVDKVNVIRKHYFNEFYQFSQTFSNLVPLVRYFSKSRKLEMS